MPDYLSTDPNAGLTEYLSTDPNAGLEGPTPSAGASPASFQPAIDYGQRMAMSPEELSQRIQAASPALEKGVALAKTPSPEWLQPAEKFMRTPLVSPEAINSLFQPVIPASVAADPVAQGIGQGASEAASQFTSPGNLALLPLIPEGAMGRVVAGGFTAQGLAQYPDLYRRFQATDDPKEKARILATAAVLVAPAAGLLPRGRLPEPSSDISRLDRQQASEPISSSASASDISLPLQPNVPEGYARFQQPVESQPDIQAKAQSESYPTVLRQSEPSATVVPAPSAKDISSQSQPELAQTAPGTQEPTQEMYSYADLPADGGFSEHPLVQFIRDEVGGILSRGQARSKLGRSAYSLNTSLWDSAPVHSEPVHRTWTKNGIYNSTSGVMPDEAAAAAVEAGVLPEGADASTLFNELKDISDASAQLVGKRADAIERIKTYASQKPSATGLPSGEVRPTVDEETSLRQPGKTTQVREQGAGPPTQEEKPVAEPVAPATAIPEGAPIGAAERYAEAEQPGTVIPGTRENAEYWRGKGRDYINQGGDPRMPIRAAQAGHVSPRNVGIVSAEHERLTQLKRQAATALETNPNNPQLQKNFQAASDAWQSWRREMQPVLTRAGESLGAAIGEQPVDLGTFDGLHTKAMELNGGRELTPMQKAGLMKRAAIVKQARVRETQAVNRLGQEIDRTLPRRAIPTREEMARIIEDQTRRLTPCR